MKTIPVVVPMLLFVFTIQAQVFQTAQLSSVIKKCGTDSVQKIERLAAFKFHKLINEYRQKNKLDTLAWNDELWLTSRNHNIWMAENSVLSHHQEEGTKFFTGIGPGERYQYATVNKGNSSWSGENALYNYDRNGEGITEISATMAETAFNQWKNSPGHDENMRGPQSHSHGTAFYLEPGGPVWATDLFSYSRNSNTLPVANELIALETAPVVKATTPKKIKVKDAQQLSSKLLGMLEKSNTVRSSKPMKKAAQRHADYMAYSKKLTHEQNKNKPGFYGKTEKQRLVRASWGLYIFRQKKNPLSESIAQLHITEIPSDITALKAQVTSALDAEKKIKGKPVLLSYGIAFRQVKNALDIYVVRLEQVRPEEIPLTELTAR